MGPSRVPGLAGDSRDDAADISVMMKDGTIVSANGRMARWLTSRGDGTIVVGPTARG